MERTADLRPIIADVQSAGASSLRQIAAGLNGRHPAARGGLGRLCRSSGCWSGLKTLTVTHIFLLWAKDLISLADPAALGGRARERTCSMKPVIGPRPSSGRPTLGMPDAPTVS